jgi:hypothetical protein
MSYTSLPTVTAGDFIRASWAALVDGNFDDHESRIVTLEGSGAGDVVGPSTSVASEIALFDGTTGKLLKRATGTGYVKVTSGVIGTPAATVPLATDVSGNLPLANLPTNFAQTFVSTTQLTDSQIKALPTTAITLVAAPASGKIIIPIQAFLKMNASAGAYTNINTGAVANQARWVLTTNGNEFSAQIYNDTASSNTMLSDFIGTTTPRFIHLYPFFANEESVYGIYTYPLDVSGFDAQALTLKAINTTNGNYTGGNAANTLSVSVIYLVL